MIDFYFFAIITLILSKQHLDYEKYRRKDKRYAMTEPKKKYRVLIVCINPYIRIEFLDYLTSFLGSCISFDAASPSELKDAGQLKDYGCILFSSRKVQTSFPLPIPETTAQLVCTRTFNHAYLDQLIRIPPMEKVYVVNDTLASAVDIIREFQESGLSQFQYIPWGPDSVNADLSVRYAITIGEPQLVPAHVQNVINIGNRIIDIATINELCMIFHLPARLSNQITQNYISHILRVIKTAGRSYASYVFSQQLLDAVISNLPLSICLADHSGLILMANSHFASDWGFSIDQAVNKPFLSFLPEDSPEISFKGTADYRIYSQEGAPFLLSVMELSFPNQEPVYLLTSKPSPLTEGKEQEIQEGKTPITNPKRNTFQNIITASDSWNKVLAYARRLALYDFPILIQGENGTQKKTLAGAIHKSSRRRNNALVSLNQMISLSGSRLQQILETANHGTLLVDNIEYLSLKLQDFLIQVFQSRSDAAIFLPKHYDIRIIATTTADLYALVEQGEFRQELFYLLSSTTIETIPLRNRREDIPLLLDHFFRNLFCDPNIQAEQILSDSLYEFMLAYDYPGNIQELQNLAQYLFSQYAALPLIMAQLPPYIRNRIPRTQTKQSTLKKQILRIIQASPKSGRASIQKALAAFGTEISDGKLRGLLKELAAENLIFVHRTKGGCEITEAGEAFLSSLG